MSAENNFWYSDTKKGQVPHMLAIFAWQSYLKIAFGFVIHSHAGITMLILFQLKKENEVKKPTIHYHNMLKIHTVKLNKK